MNAPGILLADESSTDNTELLITIKKVLEMGFNTCWLSPVLFSHPVYQELLVSSGLRKLLYISLTTRELRVPKAVNECVSRSY